MLIILFVFYSFLFILLYRFLIMIRKSRTVFAVPEKQLKKTSLRLRTRYEVYELGITFPKPKSQVAWGVRSQRKP